MTCPLSADKVLRRVVMIGFLHWFANSRHEGKIAVIDMHFVLLVKGDGSFELLNSSGEEVKDGELLDAVQAYDAGLNFSLQSGTYPLMLDPQTKALIGTFQPWH